MEVHIICTCAKQSYVARLLWLQAKLCYQCCTVKGVGNFKLRIEEVIEQIMCNTHTHTYIYTLIAASKTGVKPD